MLTHAPHTAQIILVRHGRSAHVESRWLDVEGLRAWMHAYDAAGIASSSPPPPALVTRAREATRMVSSDLPRAVASAVALVGAGAFETNALLREAPLETASEPMPRLGGARLPLGAWALVFGARWVSARLRGAPPPGVDAAVLQRATEAAAWLVESARGGRVVVVTHATFRSLLAADLVRRGWQGPSRRPVRPWSAWEFTAPVDSAEAVIHHTRSTPTPP